LRGPVLNEMRVIRDQAVANNRKSGIRVALMNSNGWFVQWIEGTQEGIDRLLQRVSGDPRHRDVMVIHHSEGRARLFRPWIGSIVQSPDSDRQFHARVHAQLERFKAGESVEPSVVWLGLSAPPAPDMPRPVGRAPRAMLLSAQGAQAFGLLEWLALKEQRVLVRRRFAGSADDAPDVESDYADFPGCGARGLRLVANARKGLAMGMTHAFLPDYAAMVLMLDGSAGRNQRLVERVLAASHQVHHTPLIVGVGGAAQATAELQDRVQRQGMPWAAAITPSATPDLAEQWWALEQVLSRLT
jgi:aromatic ring-cleaving dioxygenase